MMEGNSAGGTCTAGALLPHLQMALDGEITSCVQCVASNGYSTQETPQYNGQAQQHPFFLVVL